MPMPVQNKDRSDEVFLLALDRFETELRRFKSRRLPVTIHDLDKLETKIMSVISDSIAAQKAFFATQAKQIDDLVASQTEETTAIEGLTGDIKNLTDQIATLLTSGTLTEQDKADLIELQTSATAATAKLQVVVDASKAQSAALAALDAQNPPVVVAPPAQNR